MMHATAGAITHTRNNIPALTGLRFVAAMMVVIGHGAPLIVGMPNLVNFLMPLSGAAMAPFFVLSGFVIWLNYSQSFVGLIGTWQLRRFAVARLARLWPMYTVTILIALARMAYLGDHIPKEGTILFLFGVQGWIPAIGNTMAAFTLPLVAHLWSVSAEIFLYAFFPLFCVPISRLRNVTTVACVALVNLGLATALHHFLLYQQVAVGALVAPSLPPSAAMGWVGYYAPYPHFFEFAAGCLAARAYEILRTTPISQRETSRGPRSGLYLHASVREQHFAVPIHRKSWTLVRTGRRVHEGRGDLAAFVSGLLRRPLSRRLVWRAVKPACCLRRGSELFGLPSASPRRVDLDGTGCLHPFLDADADQLRWAPGLHRCDLNGDVPLD
jgi:hypothetical protein